MNDKVLLVFTYAGQQETIDRHLPYFRRGEADILFCYPVDAPIRVPDGCQGFATGKSEHYGSELMRRMCAAIHIAARMYRTICVIEGDSIVLRPIPAAPKWGVDCFVYRNNGENGWKAPIFVHWPWLMSHQTALDVCGKFVHLLSLGDIERGFPDRLLGYVSHLKDIPVFHRPNLSYSRNLIDRPEYVEQAREAIRNGTIFVHGIKTQAQLDSIL